jgi:sporulation protein YlmC with PRC-barrel domain
MATEVRIELLVGRVVVDSTGRKIGRIEEVFARDEGGETVVAEYHTGPAALLERLSAEIAPRWFDRGFRIPWDKLDLTDPSHPVTTCTLEDLKKFHGRKSPR